MKAKINRGGAYVKPLRLTLLYHVQLISRVFPICTMGIVTRVVAIESDRVGFEDFVVHIPRFRTTESKR